MTRVNKPSVKTLIGRVNNIKIGLMKVFTTAKSTATTRADIKPSTVTPGKIYAETNTAIALIIQLTNTFIISPSSEVVSEYFAGVF